MLGENPVDNSQTPLFSHKTMYEFFVYLGKFSIIYQDTDNATIEY